MNGDKGKWYDPSDRSQPIISPHAVVETYREGLDVEAKLHPFLLMSVTGSDDVGLLRRFHAVHDEPFLLPAFFRKLPVHTIDQAPPTSVVQKVCCAPVAADALEVAIAMGARKLYVFGFCGAIAADLEVGDVVVPFEVDRLEGTSHHYTPAGQPAEPDKELVDALCGSLVEKGVRFKAGKTVTTDAVFRQTLETELSWQEDGVLAVDAEMSALLAVAKFRGIPAVGMMVVSDKHQLEPGGEWRWGGEDLGTRHERALNLLVDLIGNRSPVGT